jgi:uncharacterized repeat protein (TIGR01451 family)
VGVPTHMRPGGRGTLDISVYNVGAAPSNGPITVTDVLPAGMTAIEAGELHYLAEEPEAPFISGEEWECSGNGSGGTVDGASIVTCTNNPEHLPSIEGGGGLPTQPSASPFKDPEVGILVEAGGEARTVVNHATVAGGGAPSPASTEDPVVIDPHQAPFGLQRVDAWFSNANGTLDTQAGSHPYEATFSYALNTRLTGEGRALLSGESRDVEVLLPPGFVGDPTAVPECSRLEFNEQRCPSDTEIGNTAINLEFPPVSTLPVYNLVPPPGVPASFGFTVFGIFELLDSEVRSGSDYGITTLANDIPQFEIKRNSITIWGEPGDSSHDPWRTENDDGGGCDAEVQNCISSGESPNRQPFLTLPTECGGLAKVTMRASEWGYPSSPPAEESVYLHDSDGAPSAFTGCEHLDFSPTIASRPDTARADTPAGLTVEVSPAVGGLVQSEGLSSADIESTTVALPEGMSINPGQAAGLQACPETEETLHENNEPPVCPSASKVGTVEIVTPLLPRPLQGDVYILGNNPPELKLLLAASGEGVNVKLIGVVHLNEATGQVVTTFAHTPELPFTSLKLAFSGGAQAALVTPTRCGVYTATSDFTPWGGPVVPNAFPIGEFAIQAGSGGQPCPASPLPYAPEMIAGSTSDQAGGFTNFSLLLRVPDDEQRTERLQFKTPEGLLGMIGQVPLCTNAQAESNTCPAASQIGHVVVQSGPGPYPLVIPEPGQPPAPIYLTEGYGGGSYGLSIVVPLQVGPFTLPTQRVRAAIAVDPLTSQLTITTDPLPQVVAGVPTDLRTIDAVIDKPEFMFNPTGCEPRSFSGTAYGSGGAQAPIASHFQVGSCRALKFQPNFTVSTSGRTSRVDGANLGVRIVYPAGGLGAQQASSQANIQTVKVELPKDLPSRLSTLQKACTAAQFAANPAGCPAASVVGSVKVLTPVLPGALTGPAYFVSNGGEAWPNLIMVLQGEGVTIHVVGDTLISKAGVTSSTFKAVPDVPIQSFELKLPEGPYSALTAVGNLCKERKSLVMPTEFIGQNGAELRERTKLAVRGCPRTTRAKRRKKPRKRGVTAPRGRRRGAKR